MFKHNLTAALAVFVALTATPALAGGFIRLDSETYRENMRQDMTNLAWGAIAAGDFGRAFDIADAACKSLSVDCGGGEANPSAKVEPMDCKDGKCTQECIQDKPGSCVGFITNCANDAEQGGNDGNVSTTESGSYVCSWG